VLKFGIQLGTLRVKARCSLYVPSGLTFRNSAFWLRIVFVFCMVSGQTGIISLFIFNRWGFTRITETESVYSVWMALIIVAESLSFNFDRLCCGEHYMSYQSRALGDICAGISSPNLSVIVITGIGSSSLY
jgi:hypothetical protein